MSDRVSAQQVAVNITGSVQVKTGSGRVIMASLNVGTAVTDFHDCPNVGAISAANKIATMELTPGTYLIDMPFLQGLAVAAGANVVSVGYV